MNVLLGFNGGSEEFANKVASALRDEGMVIDKLTTKASKSAIESTVYNNGNEFDLVIINEYLESSNPYKPKEVERLMSINEQITVVMIVNKEHYNSPYMLQLYSFGFYNAIFDKDATMSMIYTVSMGKRTRRTAMAYYGITNASIINESSGQKRDVPTPGAMVDMITACTTDEEITSLLLKAKVDLSEVDFAKLVKYLPSEIYRIGAKIPELVNYFPRVTDTEGNITKASIAPMQYKEITNDIIAIVSEENVNGVSTCLAYSLAVAVSKNTGLTPAYVQLPYYPEDTKDAYRFLSLSKKMGGAIVSHMQDVYNGKAYPKEANIYDGVSIVCSNSDSDIIDNWDLGCTYKVIYGANNPTILDVGNSYIYNDVQLILKDCSAIVVIVPIDKPIGAYLCDLRVQMGIPLEKKIIAVVERTDDGHIVNGKNYSEVCFPSLYKDDVSEQLYKKHADELNAILATTEYGIKAVGVKIKQKREKKKKFVPETLGGVFEVAVCGSQRGCGCTYNAITIASALSLHYKTAIVEINNHEDFECLGANIKSRIAVMSGISTFRYSGVDYYYGCSYEQFRKRFRQAYDFVVIDYGNEYDDNEVMKKNYVFSTVPSAEWKTDEVVIYTKKLDGFDSDNKIKCLVGGKSTKELSEFRSVCNKREFYGLAYNPKPTSPDTSVFNVISKVLNIAIR